MYEICNKNVINIFQSPVFANILFWIVFDGIIIFGIVILCMVYFNSWFVCGNFDDLMRNFVYKILKKSNCNEEIYYYFLYLILCQKKWNKLVYTQFRRWVLVWYSVDFQSVFRNIQCYPFKAVYQSLHLLVVKATERMAEPIQTTRARLS